MLSVKLLEDSLIALVHTACVMCIAACVMCIACVMPSVKHGLSFGSITSDTFLPRDRGLERGPVHLQPVTQLSPICRDSPYMSSQLKCWGSYYRLVYVLRVVVGGMGERPVRVLQF